VTFLRLSAGIDLKNCYFVTELGYGVTLSLASLELWHQ